MSKAAVGRAGQELYAVSRRVLLDALDALRGQLDALVLVGAQAVYLRCGTADLDVAIYTSDADLGVDPRRLTGIPRLETAMSEAGFSLRGEPGHLQPGMWIRTERVGDQNVDVPVDLLVPDALSGTGPNRRTAALEPHDKMAARKVAGIEVATVDHDPLLIRSLERRDPRAVEVKVAGAGALLVAKAYKIEDRLRGRPNRAADKDAGDVIRLMRTSRVPEVARVLQRAGADEVAGPVAAIGVELLIRQFGARRARGVEMAVSNLETAMDGDEVRTLAAAFISTLRVELER
jgi:hypothetical protein